IDLYQVHSFDGLVPLEETLRALDTLVTSGKVRYIGCSNFAAWQLMKALATSERLDVERFVSQQILYSLMVRDAEHELLPCGVDQGVGAILWSPLAQGFLSGKYRRTHEDSRLEKSGRLSVYDTPEGNAVLDTVLEIAESRGASGTQVAINWLRARPGVTAVLFGARSEEQLRDNLAAAEWSLTAEEVARLDKVSQRALPYPATFYEMNARDRNPLIFPRY
ncbi:MAG: aldo/keto reductase, partial [Sphingomonadales bacterium]